QWFEKSAESPLMSVVLRPPVPPGQAPQLSLVAAVAIVDALRTFGDLPGAIGWPHDVMVAERKICGMLPEAATSGPGAIGHLVLGIGLNVNQAAFPEQLSALGSSLRMERGRARDLAGVREAVLAALDHRYACFLATGVEGLREAWLARSQNIGRP